MHIIDPSYYKPVVCSKCGSANAVNPVNDRGTALRCLDCGHTKKADPPPWQQTKLTGWTMPEPKEVKNEF